MAAFLDIIGSFIVKGMIVVIVLRLTLSFQEILYERTELAVLSQTQGVITDIVEWDIRQAGYNVAVDPFLVAETSRVVYLTDIDNDSTVDQIEYTIEETFTGVPAGKQRFKLLKYQTGQSPMVMSQSVTQFRLAYFDSSGGETSNLSHIRSLLVTVRTESNLEVNGGYPNSSWEMLLFPPNL